MVETSTFKAPPFAPVDVPMEGRTHPAVVEGRNTSTAKIGKMVGQD